MKKQLLSAALVAGLLLTNVTYVPAQSLAAAPKTSKAAKAATAYKVEAAQSNLEWNGKKITGEHTGNIKVSQGELLVNNNQVVGGTVLFDMNSITNTDITDENYKQKLIGHLKSDDFFGAEKHPTGSFKITGVTPLKSATGNATHTVKGDLTLKGITHAITFPAKVTLKDGVAAAVGTATLDRTKWDIRYGSKSFFPDIADKAINDEFTVKFDLVAKK